MVYMFVGLLLVVVDEYVRMLRTTGFVLNVFVSIILV